MYNSRLTLKENRIKQDKCTAGLIKIFSEESHSSLGQGWSEETFQRPRQYLLGFVMDVKANFGKEYHLPFYGIPWHQGFTFYFDFI